MSVFFSVTGEFQNTVSKDEHIAVTQGTAQKTIHQVSRAICQHLGHLIRFPQTNEERQRTKQAFHQVAGFPGILGK